MSLLLTTQSATAADADAGASANAFGLFTYSGHVLSRSTTCGSLSSFMETQRAFAKTLTLTIDTFTLLRRN